MKITIKENIRVEVYPKTYGPLANAEQHAKDELSTCQDIVTDIKRHVDQVSSVHIEFDTQEHCSHCLYAWDVYEGADVVEADHTWKAGMPICCDAAIEEWQNEQVKQ